VNQEATMSDNGGPPPQPRYRLADGIDWPTLDGQKLEIQISPQYIMAGTKDGRWFILAIAIRPVTLKAARRATGANTAVAPEGKGGADEA
jgi:hypothetical protein